MTVLNKGKYHLGANMLINWIIFLLYFIYQLQNTLTEPLSVRIFQVFYRCCQNLNVYS